MTGTADYDDVSASGGEGTEDPGLSPTQTAALPTNERDYLIPAQDAKGHHIRLYCRAPPTIGRIVADVHASRKYPFRTMGDLVRWCIVHGAKRLAAGAGVPSVIAISDAMTAMLVDEEFQLAFLDFFQHLHRVIDNFIAAGSPGEARRVAAKCRAQIESMPDTQAYWKQRYRDELLKRYATLLDAPGEPKGGWDADALAASPAIEGA